MEKGSQVVVGSGVKAYCEKEKKKKRGSEDERHIM